MSIRSQDDYELFAHITMSWQSIRETIEELNRRNRSVLLTNPTTTDVDPLAYKMEFIPGHDYQAELEQLEVEDMERSSRNDRH